MQWFPDRHPFAYESEKTSFPVSPPCHDRDRLPEAEEKERERMRLVDMSLAGKSIYLIGPRKLENEVMARFLEKETTARCRVVSFKDISELAHERVGSKSGLILIDPREPHLRAWVMEPAAEKSSLEQSWCMNNLFHLHSLRSGNGNRNSYPSGRCGFFYDCRSPDDFLWGIRKIFFNGNGNGMSIREEGTVRLIRSGDHHVEGDVSPLTRREFHLLFMLSGGLKNGELSARLNISPHTVRTHLYNIFKKICVRNRLEASLWLDDHVGNFFFLI